MGDETIRIPRARFDQLVTMTTITHVDGKPVPASRVLAWVEANLIRLGAAPSLNPDGRMSADEFADLDVHELSRFSDERMREALGW